VGKGLFKVSSFGGFRRYSDSLDKQIDDLGFDLYGLSEEERKII